MTSPAIERAAGGIVVRTRENTEEVLLIHDAYGHVSFPKGHVEPGETWEEAALREILEETGIAAEIVAPLGRVEYPIERNGKPVRKQVRLFLLIDTTTNRSPVAQVEEINGAYFTSWADALRQQNTSGYANWSWVLPKARVLWQWFQVHGEEVWRPTPATLPLEELTSVWKRELPSVQRLVECVSAELAVVAPEWFPTVPQPDITAYQLPLPAGKVPALPRAIEHTLLKPEAGLLDIMKIVHEARQYDFAAVCVNPQYIGAVADALDSGDPEIRCCAVVGFPLGAASVAGLAAEATAVIEAGAREVDMVIPVGSMREDDIWSVFHRVRAVTEVAHVQDAKVKVILETHFLTLEQVMKAALVSLQAGADFLKTSTGFAPSGANIMDVAVLTVLASLMSARVKAAGGIRNRVEAENFLRFGASRLGTSSGLAMVRQ